MTFEATTDGTKRLVAMRYAGRTWAYSGVAALGSFSLMTGLAPPTGPGWTFSYHGSSATLALPYGLQSLTTPFGGVVSYEYQQDEFYLGATVPVRSPVLSRKTVGGVDLVPGAWTYAYAQGPDLNQTVITSPCQTTVHTFDGVGNFMTVGEAWRVGLPTRRQVRQGSTVLQTEDLEWQASVPISYDSDTIGFNHDAAIFVPLSRTRVVNRGAGSCTALPMPAGCYKATNTYRTTNYNDYGRPWTVAEEGEFSRTTTLTYAYGFSPRYIVDKVAEETLRQGSESFTSSYAYATATGFRTSQTIRGVTTAFTPDARGNLAVEADAHGHQRRYQYSWGTASRMDTPTYSPLRTRVVNADGTIQSETRWRPGTSGLTTTFEYDALMRLRKTTPPVGNPTVTQYDLVSGSARYKRTTRGASRLDTHLDGFGRLSATANGVGVRTDVSYDACGRRTYESLPYTDSNSGYGFAYDGLGRTTRKTNPDGTFVAYAFSRGVDVTIEDERGSVTVQDWSACGDPGEARLVKVTDAQGEDWTYTYNALGNLTRVVPPLGPERTWTYYGSDPGGRPGLLKAETHPESGTVDYTYDAAGRLDTRTDAHFGTTRFQYDADDRLTAVDRPGGVAHDKTFAWDESGNRALLANAYVRSTLAYDAANRLVSRTDVVNPCFPSTPCPAAQTLTTSYPAYDGNDNPLEVVYPSGTRVTWTYDSENRILAVGKPGSPGAFASGLTYHPSGNVSAYVTGNGLSHTVTYDDRYFVQRIDSGGVLGLTYAYDEAGNPTRVTEGTRTEMSQTLTYDALDRLSAASGPWGSATFGYDARGNRTRKTVAGKTTTYAYDSWTGRLSSSSGAEAAAHCYDTNGNTTFAGAGPCSTQYTYTPDNMLQSAASASGTTNYRYDADDLRTLKLEDSANHYYVHGQGGQLLSELVRDGAGLRSVRDYVHAGARLVAAVRPSAAPFGSFDTPAENATGLAGAVAVTGWALDEHGIDKVRIWRDAVPPEPPGQVYVGDGVFIPGARPDVRAAYPSFPDADRAGWGLSVLTNFLPAQGNGSYTLHAYAHDDDGNVTLLGTKRIAVDNAHSVKPFGTLDTPAQGGTASGAGYLVWGWALTPQPAMIPIDGSTIGVYVDGVPLGRPVYNLQRADIVAAFPGYANTNGAVGYFVLDTTRLANGIHTIGWLVTDNGGHAEGIGSRFFWVQN